MFESFCLLFGVLVVDLSEMGVQVSRWMAEVVCCEVRLLTRSSEGLKIVVVRSC